MMLRLLLVLLLSQAVAVAVGATSGVHLVVNELMQSNIDCVMDDLNDFPDSWVELYNDGSSAAQLNRYALGITPNADEAWTLPNKSVAAGGRLLIYCDKVGDGLHAPFRLETNKDFALYLFCNGQVIDQVGGLQKQPAPNIAYGRKDDGGDEWGYQLTPTPGAPNCGEVCDHDHILGHPVFSEPGRVVTGSGSLRLSLTLPDGSPSGTEIRYTVNGTEPTRSSTLYTAPLTISSNQVVRAKLFCQGWLSPRSVTQSYIFFPRELTLPVVSIVTDNTYLNGMQTGIFANNTSDKRVNWRRPINIEFFFDGEGTPSNINQLCETRVAGAASRGADKKSMAIYAHKRFGEKRFDYEFFPDQCPGLTDYKSLVLRNAGNDFHYLYLRDIIVQRTMAEHSDIDWQAWRPAIVYINGKYHCILNIRERANENNVYTHYGLEDIDLIENWYDLKEGTMDAFNEFKAFYKETGHTLAEFEQWMDCMEFLDLMVMNLYFCNFDFPGNNIIMWRPRTPTSQLSPLNSQLSRWRWIAKDCDYTLGLYGEPVTYNIIEWLYNPNYDSKKNWGANGSSATRLFRRLMDDADFRREFIDRCAIYMGDFLNESGVRAVWDPMYEQIEYEYPYHRKLINQWWPNYANEMRTAQDWLKQRTAIFYSQLGDYYKLGTPIPMGILKTSSEMIDISFNGVHLSKGVFDGQFFPGRQITLEAKAPEGKMVSGWKVQKIYGSSSSTEETTGEQLSLTMPQCWRLNIMPIVTDASAIASQEVPSWTWQRQPGGILLSGVPQGTSVALYDLRGILLHETRGNGSDILLPTSSGKPFLLKVGDRVVKL